MRLGQRCVVFNVPDSWAGEGTNVAGEGTNVPGFEGGGAIEPNGEESQGQHRHTGGLVEGDGA